MSANEIKNVLITQNQLKNYAGSEMTVLELAEHFSLKDCEITILTALDEEPILDEFKSIPRTKVVNWFSPEASSLQANKFDLIWVHHQLLTPAILRDLTKTASKKRPIVVFNHMSYINDLEYPVMLDIEQYLSDVTTYNSLETKEHINETGVYFNNEQIYNNPAPDAFYNDNKEITANKTIRKIAIVSNHPPKEIIDAASMLSESNIEINFFGREVGEHQRITPEVIQDHNVVVSIGKTVQYCLVGGVPIYCYDRFGGPGFLTKNNFGLASKNNFSGRGFEKKQPNTIRDEIMKDYQKSLVEVKNLHRQHSQSLLLSSTVERIINEARNKRKNNSTKPSQAHFEAFNRYIRYRTEIFSEYQKYFHKYKKEVQSHKKTITVLEKQRAQTSSLQKRVAKLELPISVKIKKFLKITSSKK